MKLKRWSVAGGPTEMLPSKTTTPTVAIFTSGGQRCLGVRGCWGLDEIKMYRMVDGCASFISSRVRIDTRNAGSMLDTQECIEYRMLPAGLVS